MRINKILWIIVALWFQGQAQIHEIGGFVGGSNYIGDIGKDDFIAPNHISFGGIYRWNKSPRHAYRLSYTYGKITANDLDVAGGSRAQRGLQFENRVHDITLGLEINFLEFDLHQFGIQTTPYVMAGISYFNYKENYFINKQLQFDQNAWSMGIPMIVGVKSKLTRSLVIGAEIGARYTFTDNLDGSNPKNDNLANRRFGNLNSNDWYVFTGFTLTYTFGNNPCYCPY